MKCLSCGKEFDEKGLTCLSSCPEGGGCRRVCCPFCGYIMPEDTALSKFLKKILKGVDHGKRDKERDRREP